MSRADPPTVERSEARREFWRGVRDVSPMLLAVGPFGAVTGLAAVASGLGVGQAVAFSALVNAGSSQLAALQLAERDAHLGILLLTTLLVNGRFFIYGVTIASEFAGIGRGWRLLMAHTLVDQTFALLVRRRDERPEARHTGAYYAGLALPLFPTWVGGSFVGAAFGTSVPAGWSIDFTIPLIFIALLVPAVRDRPAVVTVLVSGAVALAAAWLPLNLGLVIAALTGIAAGLLAERRWRG